jgi:hypothetical protein
MTGRVANRKKDRPVLAPGKFQRLGIPRMPVDWIRCVLQKVWAGLAGQSIGHSPSVRREVASRDYLARTQIDLEVVAT